MAHDTMACSVTIIFGTKIQITNANPRLQLKMAACSAFIHAAENLLENMQKVVIILQSPCVHVQLWFVREQQWNEACTPAGAIVVKI